MTARVPREPCLSCKKPPKKWAKPIPARGLCPTCYNRHWTDGTLDQFPRTLKRRAEVVEDWEFLRDQGYTYRQAAERIGMTYDAFCKVMARAKHGQQKAQAA